MVAADRQRAGVRRRTAGRRQPPPATHVSRVVTLGIPWSLRLLQPILVREFRTESGRTLLALKVHADGLP